MLLLDIGREACDSVEGFEPLSFVTMTRFMDPSNPNQEKNIEVFIQNGVFEGWAVVGALFNRISGGPDVALEDHEPLNTLLHKNLNLAHIPKGLLSV
jgi:hypothetical protein